MRSKDLQRRADEAAVASSSLFVVTTFVGRAPDALGPVRHSDLYTRREFATLEEARAYRQQLGTTDQWGRRACVYAVTKEGYTIHVD